jgi:hypothetical protein
MKIIALSRGMEARVDDADYPSLARHKWSARPTGRHTKTYYAYRISTDGTILMHRFIMGLGPHDKEKVDHRDNDGLNNQRDNLRVATNSQNGANRRPNRNAASRYKGVIRRGNRWRARITIDQKQRIIGNFDTDELAARAYDEEARRLFGEFARTNFP